MNIYIKWRVRLLSLDASPAHLFPAWKILDLGKHAGHLGGIREFGARVASLGNGPDSGRNSVHKIPTKLLSTTSSRALEEER